MSNHHKEGFMEGLFCLLQAPFGAAAATEHHLSAPFGLAL
jgi:hypothetical protein